MEGAQAALRRPGPAPRWSSGSTTSSASSATWASPPTSWWCGTSSASPGSRASGSGPGRGSAAGCCVAYCLRIVDLDPIRYDLLFERFLNPGRKQMPDIDMDFDERYRADVMRYAAEKYGSDRVAQIVTFSTIKARAAVRDAARVLGKPYIVGDKIAKAMPPLVMGRDTPLQACLTKTEGHEDGYAAAGELRAMYETDPEAKEVIDVALGPRGPAPPGRDPRRRRGHLPRPADRVPAHPAQARRRRATRGRPDRHPVRDARGRGARAAEDGLPRACATSRSSSARST